MQRGIRNAWLGSQIGQQGIRVIGLVLVLGSAMLSMGGCPSDDPLSDLLPPVVLLKAAAAPEFEPNGGTFSGSVQVTLKIATSGATLRFSTDGSTPSAESGTLCDGPITLTETTQLRAIAIADGFEPSPIAFATFTKTGSGQGPTISNIATGGALVQGKASGLTVGCNVTAGDRQVQSVVVDLRSVGGPAAQALSGYGSYWSWAGEVTASSSGSKTIPFTAYDQQGGSATASTTVTVTSNQAPSISSASATGNLTQGQSGTVTVSCTANDTDGTIQLVTADLSALGGSNAQPLAFETDHWTWAGDVTPASSGSKTVAFTAADDGGKTGSASATISVVSGQPGTLAGEWTGDITYSQALALGTPPYPTSSFVHPTTMTFSADYQPQTLAIFFGQSRQVFVMAADGLRNVGDQKITVYPGSPNTSTITFTVTAISRSATAFSIDMNVLIAYSGGTNGSLTGTYHWAVALQPGEQLSWSETTPLVVGGLGISLNVSSTGTLGRP